MLMNNLSLLQQQCIFRLKLPLLELASSLVENSVKVKGSTNFDDFTFNAEVKMTLSSC